MRQWPKAREGSTGNAETGGSPLEQALIEAARDQRVHELARVLRDQDDHLEERRNALEEEELRSTERRRHGARARLAARRSASEETAALVDEPVAASVPPAEPESGPEPTSGATPRPSETESDLLAAVLPLETVLTFARSSATSMRLLWLGPAAFSGASVRVIGSACGTRSTISIAPRPSPPTPGSAASTF